MDQHAGSGIRYTDQDQETALQVWAFLADRSPRKTSDILQETYGIAVPAKRIGEWARNQEWHTKAQDLYRAQAPDLYDQAKFTLTASAPGAARYLYDVSHKNPDGTYIEPEPDRVRVQAAFGVLDRIGFLPMSRRDVGQVSPMARPVPASSGVDDISSLSDEELRALAAGDIDLSDLNASTSTDPASSSSLESAP